MLLLLDEQSKKLEILAEAEHDNTNLQSYLQEKEIEVNSLNSKLNSLNSKVSSLNQTYMRRFRLKEHADPLKEQKMEDKEHAALNFGSRIEEFTSTLERLRVSEPKPLSLWTQFLQERFYEQSLTLRITKEANRDLNVSLNDLNEQLKAVQFGPIEYAPSRHGSHSRKNTALKLIADKCQADLVMTQQTNTTLNGRLVDMAVTQEKNASLKAPADK
ncbi:hypothetical protein FIBSPDRAFT_963159 [Athelia psychrophila]|uniref:Uncharacterized protein n=1 Tax=Athelia psychrophila TaxID=1759441 RepID=A0A165Z937_9AGAM|nr:hypothetical protein FIBSPDRAFT_963159 [Fibularhizoctonia sp. CBS 109695]